MADKKITQLTNITGANLVDADEFVVVDISADETKSITLSELKTAFDSASGFVRITGDTMTGDLALGDNVKAIFGTGSDLQIYHDGNSKIADVGGGKLELHSDGTGVFIQKGATEYMAQFLTDGAVSLYHDNAAKLATTSTGVDVTGTLTSDGLTSSAVITAQEGRSNTAGTGQIVIDPDDTSVSAAFRLDQADNKLNIDMINGGSWQKKLSVYTGGDIRFYEDTGTTPKFFWDASAESLGIGTSSPSAIFQVEAADGAAGGAIMYTATGAASGYMSANPDGLCLATDTAGITFRTGITGADPTDTGTERMRIDSSGKLSLTASDQGIQIGPDVAAYTIKRDSGGLLNFNATQATFNGYIFDTADGERMRIDSSGKVLVGTTSSTGNSAIAQFKRAGAGASGYFEVLNNTGASQNAVDIVSATNAAFTPLRFWVNGYGTTLVGSIATTTSSTSYNTSSDYRLKTDAQPMTGASDRVLALNPVNFEWIADGTRVDGFLAHEAQAVVPEAVTGTKDAMMDEEYQVSAAKGDIYTAGSEAGFNEVSAAIEASPAYYDVDGNIIKAEVIAKAAVHEAYDAVEEVIHSTNVEQPETLEDGQQWRETTPAVMGTRSVPYMQGIDQSKMVPLLVASLQEALARITALENA